MKKTLLTLLAITLAAPAFAGNRAPKVETPAALVDSSGKTVTTEANAPVVVAPAAEVVEPAKAPAKKVVKKATKKAAKKAAAPATH